ncbi:motility associated factor glycosyltransferase family protein [Clostridium butyricum]|uniref:motility associated factor glycosyltransferase family protein n=1 Tax=Clostridium butyricum TaxID=1492 RepID=UPI001371DE93|nr:6-hydroxymethylpterin diphosphokinase MptE-like protein [Clostridium butyricum]MZI81031.1 DUF115 domain-containing protein [Clostridium butyricum]
MNNIYKKNMRFLKRNASILYSKIINNQDKSTYIEKIGKGKKNIIKYIEGNEYRVHSSYDADFQGEILGRQINIDKCDVVVIFGMGLGYEIKQIIKIVPNKIYVVIEPDTAICQRMLENIDFNEFLLYGKNVKFTLTDDANEIGEELRIVLEKNKTTKVQFVVLPFYSHKYMQLVNESFESMRKIIKGMRVNTVTNLVTDRQWLLNYIVNTKYLKDTISMTELNDKFRNIPAIIVGAGPSVELNLEHLKKVYGHALIVGAGNGARVLEKNNIKADIIGAMDGTALSEKIYTDFKLNNNAVLFYSTQVFPTIPDMIGKNKILMNQVAMDNYIYKKIWNINKNTIFSGPSITNVLAYNLAQMGCNPIIFLGQDLCGQPEKIYSSGTIYDEDSKLNTKLPIEIKNKKNEVCYTNESYLTMKYSMESIIKAFKGTEFLNGTDSGVHISGSIDIDFNEYADNTLLLSEKISFDSMLKEIKSDKNDLKEEIQQLICDIDLEINNIYETLNKAIEKIKGNENNAVKINFINVIDKQLMSFSFFRDVLNSTFRKELDFIYGKDEQIEKMRKIYLYYLEKCHVIKHGLNLIKN